MKKTVFLGLLVIYLAIGLSCSLPQKIKVSTPHELKEPTPHELKELALSLPPYSTDRDCGFEALSVFERFGGDLVVAQQGFTPDGIYTVRKTDAPRSWLNDPRSNNWHGFLKWNNILYIYYHGFGCFEVINIKPINIIEHRGVNMAQNGPHVWNIINGIVIDISWARQNMDTFLETVIITDYIWNNL